jgi:hypothetical protein
MLVLRDPYNHVTPPDFTESQRGSARAYHLALINTS